MEIVVGIWQYEFDTAGLGRGLVVALLFAAVSLDRRVLKASLSAFAAYATVHFVYQVLHFDGARAVTAALLFQVLLAIGLLTMAQRLNRRKIAGRRRNVAFFVLGHEPPAAAPREPVTSRNHRL